MVVVVRVPDGVVTVLRVVVVPFGDVVVVDELALCAKLMPQANTTVQTNPISFLMVFPCVRLDAVLAAARAAAQARETTSGVR